MAAGVGYPVQRSAPIKSQDHNQLVEDLQRVLRISTGPGLSASWGSNGIVLALAAATQDWFIPARITSASGANPDLPANITYGVKGIFEDSATMTSAIPAYGRPVKGADAAFTKIRPAAVGSFCYILRDRNASGVVTAKLVLLPGGSEGETLFYETCSAAAAAAPAAPEDQPVTGGIAGRIARWFGG